MVKHNDYVFLLGDLMLNDNVNGIKKLNKLNGTIYYIRGNHCSNARCVLYKEQTNMIPLCNDFFSSWASLEKIKGYSLYLSHYPTIIGALEDMTPLNKRLINLHDDTLAPSGYDICKYIVENHIPLVGFHLHTMNPVGRENMRRLLTHYGYKEI